MKKMLIVLSFIVLICAFASAQPKMTASGRTGGSPIKAPQPSYCSPCLYYSGDFDPFGPNPDGLFNDTDIFGINGQVYFPIAPSSGTVPIKNGFQTKESVLVYSISINEFATGVSDFDAMSYDIRKQTSEGFAGSEVASGACITSAPIDTGINDFGLEIYTFTCTLPSPIRLNTGLEYFIAAVPDFNGGDIGYLCNSNDAPVLNGFAAGTGGFWGNVTQANYFNGFFGEFNFENTNYSDPFAGFDQMMSFSVAGKYH